MNKTVEKIPTWAFGYIFNGDMTGLTDEEVQPYFTRNRFDKLIKS